MSAKPKGRCPNCGSPLVNIHDHACCLRTPGCSKLQEKLPSKLDTANVREVILGGLAKAEVAGKAKDCKLGWFTLKIFRIPGVEGYFRRKARGRAYPTKGADRRWVAGEGKLIEVAEYEPRDGDKMLPVSEGSAS